MYSFHSNLLHTNTSLHHSVEITQPFSTKVFDHNFIANTAVSTQSNKTTITHTTSTINNDTVSAGNSNAKQSKHVQSQSTSQHKKKSNNNNNNFDNNILSSNIANKHPGCLCLVM